jgi:hypothetical protein
MRQGLFFFQRFALDLIAYLALRLIVRWCIWIVASLNLGRKKTCWFDAVGLVGFFN